jgi:hypothetical protein
MFDRIDSIAELGITAAMMAGAAGYAAIRGRQI